MLKNINVALKRGFLVSVLFSSSGVALANPSFKINSGDTRATEGRCYMGSCPWSKTMFVHVIQNTAEQSILEVGLLGGESKNKRGKVVWNETPHKVSITCSFRHPSIGVDGQLDDLPLAPSGVPGVLEDSANLYFHFCHSYDGGTDAGIRKFGYNVVDSE